MSNVTFEEESKRGDIPITPQEKQGLLIRILIKTHIVKNTRQASNFLLIFSVLFILLSASIVTLLLARNNQRIIPYDEQPESVKAKLPESARKLYEER